MVCLDETSKQLIGEVALPVPAAPGQVAHYDYEYVRNGVANLFMVFEPLAGRRKVEVTDRRGNPVRRVAASDLAVLVDGSEMEPLAVSVTGEGTWRTVIYVDVTVSSSLSLNRAGELLGDRPRSPPAELCRVAPDRGESPGRWGAWGDNLWQASLGERWAKG